jgi:hypothetical protein
MATEDTESKDLLRKTYDMATQRLREEYAEEFIDLRKAAAKELGVEWEPRLTPEQRAAQEFDSLIRQYPHLADRIPQEG